MRWIFIFVILFVLTCIGIPISASDGVVPDILFAFQQPSYLTDKNPILSEFTCDITKPDCRVNFDLSPSFTGGFLSSDFTCSLDFGMRNPTGEEAKCNPNTVVFTGSFDYTVRFRIAKKTDATVFLERILIIHSGHLVPETFSGTLSDSGSITDSGSLSDTGTLIDSWSVNSTWIFSDPEVLDNSWTLSETGSMVSSGNVSPVTDNTLPDILFAFQQPSYLTDKNPILSEFTCDTAKPDCRVNFDLSASFTGGFLSSDFTCSLDFGLKNPTGEEAKCNPNTVVFTGSSDYTVRFRIAKKVEPDTFSERILIIHSGYASSDISSEDLSDSGAIGGSGTIFEIGTVSTGSAISPIVVQGGSTSPLLPSSISISDPTIVIQSGLDSNNRCMKADCTVNFEYKALDPKESCHWDFSGGSYLSGTENKCNPGYIHYQFGEFTVMLRVFEQGNASNYREKILRFSNKIPVSRGYEAKTDSVNHLPIAVIRLQGILGKTKIQQGNSIQCIGVDECSINLSGEESYDPDNDGLTYHWNFWNGTVSDKKNPPAVKYGTGEYSVVLLVTEARGYSWEAIFRVSVSGKNKKEVIQEKSIDSNVSSLRITGANPNPLGNDGVSEWVEIENPSGSDIPLSGCTLDDEMGKGSNPYIFDDSAIIRAGSRSRYYKLQTKLEFNNTGDSVNLICNEKLISAISWDYPVPEGFVVSGKEWPYIGKIRTKVLRVVDGDTIVAEVYGKQEKIRLIGVDTPETVDFRKNVQFYGKEASDFTKNRLEWREIELEFDFDPRDKYDRLLAYVWIDGTNFDLELIRLGYGRAYLRFPFRYFKEFEKVGRETEKNKLGMWADPEMKKLLDSDRKEDKRLLEKKLREEDLMILDDLVRITEDAGMDAEGLVSELLDRIQISGNEKEIPDIQKHANSSEVRDEQGIEDIHISLQGKISKNRKLAGGNIFTCQTKTNCSVNFTAGKARKNTVYYWDFGNGETFYGANPPAHRFPFGKYVVRLKILDTKTFSFQEERFSVVVKKLINTKKPKSPKKIAMKTENEKPLIARWRDYFAPLSSRFLGLSPLQASIASIILVSAFFGGVYFLFRRKGMVEISGSEI